MLFNINILICLLIKAFFVMFFCKGVTGGVMLPINPAAPVLHVPLVLEEVVEKTFVIEVCTVSLFQL